MSSPSPPWNNSLALQADGTVLAWGSQNAVPASATNVVAIAAGSEHFLALRAGGILIGWGENYYGQATCPSSLVNVVGLAAGGDYSLALLGDGTVVAWGGDYFGQTSVPVSATNVIAVSAGGAHSLALAGSQSNPSSVAVGASVSLTAGSLDRGGASFQWQLNGLDIPGATNAVLAIPFANWTNAGTYRVVVSGTFGSVTGPPMVLTVVRSPLWFDTSPGGIVVSNNGTHLRVLGASGVGPIVLFASTNLSDWEPILTNPPAIGMVQFIDTEAAVLPERLYRAAEGTVAGPLQIEIAASPSQTSYGALPLQVTGLTATGPVIIYASSNLLDWGAVFTNPPTIGPLQYLEGLSTVQPLRFYRASEDRQP